ncbi:hypothetical protein AOQ84DRAFT_334112 [Glonium stellatum]|uniref:Uncharacterized protein n=1 Tax=Glonium stellatum TaxID=574774 RepID=A0A8E2F930_9PEZI|nr:hypothetical protein AOQ84DRAFT_334112 [Glonium stellatum]
MSGFKGLAKGGWHPKGKDGGKESWRGDFKGINTVAGWVGKGKDPAQEAREHESTPLSTLKDPASFGPPPKHVNYHDTAAVPNATTQDRSGLGVPLSQDEIDARQRAKEAAEAEANKPPPGPYKVNTSGLSTAHLPKPPVRRLDQDSQPPASQERAKPKLPPRLPPRQNSHPDTYSAAPPPSYNESTQDAPIQSYINQGAMVRLGQAGISVPGFNIGRNASPPVPPRQTSSPPAGPVSPASSKGPQLGELQARFAKMSTASPKASQEPNAGTSLAQKQAALKTASALRSDPSSVSVSDMRSAASTANNFRERHGEQVASGWRMASGLNQKYGVSERVSGFASGSTPTPPAASSPVQGAIGKKPPPPPPPKKKDLVSSPSEPPPIPLGSKPKF